MDGYSVADGYGNSKIWKHMRSRQKKVRCSSNNYEAEVSSRVMVLTSERAVVDFGKLFTETNERKFSLGGV